MLILIASSYLKGFLAATGLLPALGKAFGPRKEKDGRGWRMAETYIKVKSEKNYLSNHAYGKPLFKRKFKGVKGWRRIANRRISSAIIKAFKSIDATRSIGINGDKNDPRCTKI
jgi:hypothetical protein